MTENVVEVNYTGYPADIVADADSREPWPSETVRVWYMEGRLYEREHPGGSGD